LFPDFRDENESLLALQEQQEQEQQEQSWSKDDSMDRTEPARRDSSHSDRKSGGPGPKARPKPTKPTTAPPTMERTSAAWYYSTQITGRDLFADLHHHNKTAKEAEKKHIIMTIL